MLNENFSIMSSEEESLNFENRARRRITDVKIKSRPG